MLFRKLISVISLFSCHSDRPRNEGAEESLWSLSERFTGVNPLSFLRGGAYWYSSGGLSNKGNYGYYWNPQVVDTINSKYLLFGSTSLTPQVDANRDFGFSLRCIVRIPSLPQIENK